MLNYLFYHVFISYLTTYKSTKFSNCQLFEFDLRFFTCTQHKVSSKIEHVEGRLLFLNRSRNHYVLLDFEPFCKKYSTVLQVVICPPFIGKFNSRLTVGMEINGALLKLTQSA